MPTEPTKADSNDWVFTVARANQPQIAAAIEARSMHRDGLHSP
jgi:hypothetical protein